MPWCSSKQGGNSAEGVPANKYIKEAEKGELSCLPNFPEGFDQARLKGIRKDLVDEMQKRTPNGQLVKQKMDMMFELRRNQCKAGGVWNCHKLDGGTLT